MAQRSTALSDLVLTLTSLLLIYHIYPTNIISTAGLLVQAMAAALGVAKFGMKNPPTSLIRLHGYTSWLAIVLGSALLSAGFLDCLNYDILMKLNIGFAALFTITSPCLTAENVTLLTRAMSGFSLLSLLIAGLLYRSIKFYVVLGAICYIIGGGVVGTRGAWFSVPRVDILHYVVATGNILFFYEKF